MHARTQIRNALVTLLTGLSVTGANVFSNRVTSYNRPTETPALNILTTEEEFDRTDDYGEMGAVQLRSIDIDIEGRIVTDGVSDIDDQMDALALTVEQAIQTDPDLGGLLAMPMEYAGTSLSMDDETEKETGLVTVRYGARYTVNETDPQTIIT